MDYYDEIRSDEMHERNKLKPEIITATTAKEMTDKVRDEMKNDSITEIMGMIMEGIERGDYNIHTGPITDVVINVLKS